MVFALKGVFSSSGEAGGKDEEMEGSGQELIARLRAAEEEARALKEQLNVQQASFVGSQPEIQEENKSGKRIDGGDLRRETLSFVESRPRNWLSESDVEFFTGGGPSEASGESTGPSESSEEEKSIVNRRIVFGLAGSLGLIAFALVPTGTLCGRLLFCFRFSETDEYEVQVVLSFGENLLLIWSRILNVCAW